MPHDHAHVLGRWHMCSRREVERAIKAALDAHTTWSRMPWQHRAAIFLKAADLLSGPYRKILNGATMLGQSKTCHQAEIDSAVITSYSIHYTKLYDAAGGVSGSKQALVLA